MFDSSHTYSYHHLDRLWIVKKGGRGRIALVLTAFGDESYDEQGSRVFAVAALVGSAEEWEAVTDRWHECTGQTIFHAADCEADRGRFAEQSHSENLDLYKNLTRIIAGSELRGAGVAMDLKGYNEYFPERVAELPYFICFWNVLVYFAKLASRCSEKVHFAFDHRKQIHHNAAELYSYMANLEQWDHHVCLDSDISFVSRETTEIQVADLLARETMKHLENQVGPVRRQTRRSMNALVETNRFDFGFLTREYFRSLRQETEGLAVRAEYHEWIQRKSLQDNFSNRLRYLISLGPEEAVASLERHSGKRGAGSS
jgi:hypothetical protein